MTDKIDFKNENNNIMNNNMTQSNFSINLIERTKYREIHYLMEQDYQFYKNFLDKCKLNNNGW